MRREFIYKIKCVWGGDQKEKSTLSFSSLSNFLKGANFILKRIPSDFGLHSYIREAIDFFYVQRNDADNEYLD